MHDSIIQNSTAQEHSVQRGISALQALDDVIIIFYRDAYRYNETIIHFSTSVLYFFSPPGGRATSG